MATSHRAWLARSLVLTLALSAAAQHPQQHHPLLLESTRPPEAVGEPATALERGRRASCPAPAAKSRGPCESCYLGSQCPDGFYCCPYMRKCVDSGTMACNYPIANCQTPRCFDASCQEPGSNACDCPGCANVGPGTQYSWREWANLDNSNDAGALAKTCDDGGGGAAAATTTAKATTKAAPAAQGCPAGRRGQRSVSGAGTCQGGAGAGTTAATAPAAGCTAGAAGCLTEREVDHFDLLNAARAEGFTCPDGTVFAANPTPLVFDCRLWRASQLHSKDMGDNGYFAHASQDGRTPWDRADAQGLSANGENIAAGRGGAQAVLDQWLDSNGHCLNMGKQGFKMAAVGYASVAGSTYTHYWTQMFKSSLVGDADHTCIPGTAPANSAPPATTAPPASNAGSSTGNCPAPAAKSRGPCESCYLASQCPDGFYCCPYMRKCVDSGTMSCRSPIANCQNPRCFDSSCQEPGSNACDCPGCANVGPGTQYSWREWANLDNSNDAGALAKTCDDGGGGAPPPSTPAPPPLTGSACTDQTQAFGLRSPSCSGPEASVQDGNTYYSCVCADMPKLSFAGVCKEGGYDYRDECPTSCGLCS